MLITTAEWGFILMSFIVAEVLTWIVGFDLTLKEKIFMPLVIIGVVVLLTIAIRLMIGG